MTTQGLAPNPAPRKMSTMRQLAGKHAPGDEITMVRRCANCDIRIQWQGTVVDGMTYCCLGCSQGGPCSCDYFNLPRDTGNAGLVSPGAEKREHRNLHRCREDADS